MRVFAILVVAGVLASAAPAAGRATCTECGASVERESAVRYGMKTFCSDSCRDAFVERERETTSECEICGAAIRATPREMVTGRTRYVWINEPPVRRYCTRCQRDINNGKIDPANPPLLSDRSDEETKRGENPYAVDKFDWEKKKKREVDEEAHSGYGAMTYVIAIGAALFFLIRWFLKS